MARNVELERTLVDHPEDVETYLVYADWLQKAGDPRGELIALALACERDPRDEKLFLMTEAYRARHAESLVGPLADALTDAVWHRGFISSLQLPRFPALPADQLLTAILEHPSAALLRSLDVGQDDPHPALAVLGRIAPPALRALRIASVGPLGSLEPLYPLALESLVIDVVHMTGAREVALSKQAMQSIAAAPWQLTSLQLDFGTGNATFEDLAPLLRRDLPLERLDLRLSPRDRRVHFTRDICHALVDSPFAARLVELALHLRFERDDYRFLVENRERFPRAKQIIVPSRHFYEKLSAQS